MTTTATPAAPYITRTEKSTVVTFAIHEGQTWDGSDIPRATLEVEVYRPVRGAYPARVSWSSTSDKRPELAALLAQALLMAANEARLLDMAAATESN